MGTASSVRTTTSIEHRQRRSHRMQSDRNDRMWKGTTDVDDAIRAPSSPQKHCSSRRLVCEGWARHRTRRIAEPLEGALRVVLAVLAVLAVAVVLVAFTIAAEAALGRRGAVEWAP